MKEMLLHQILQLSKDYFQETVSTRHHLHQHPELSFKEYKTADFVEQKLRDAGFTHISRMANTGVVALLRHPGTKGKVVGLRADLDALPIYETNNVHYKSVNAGVMHACGHDVHTAILLTVAKICMNLKERIAGNIKFIFQPGEELLPGGASLLINEGVLLNPEVDCLIAQHVTPQIPSGKIGFRKGLFMASTDEIYITIKGKGGHAAMPDTYINPLLISSALISKLHDFFMINKSENINQIPTVLAFGKIEGLGATNVIPSEVKLAGTFRTLNEEWRALAHSKIAEIVKHITTEMQGSYELNINRGYPCLVNDEQVTETCMQAASEIIGDANIIDLPHRMTAEDFAYFSQQKPVCFYRLGTGNVAAQSQHNVHTSDFNIDENVLKDAPAVMTAMTIQLLEQ
jgi:amidohydrolase